MKFVWEGTDIVAGIMVQNPKTTEKFVIGILKLEDGPDMFALVSVVGAEIFPTHGYERNQMASYLNNFGALPIKSA